MLVQQVHHAGCGPQGDQLRLCCDLDGSGPAQTSTKGASNTELRGSWVRIRLTGCTLRALGAASCILMPAEQVTHTRVSALPQQGPTCNAPATPRPCREPEDHSPSCCCAQPPPEHQLCLQLPRPCWAEQGSRAVCKHQPQQPGRLAVVHRHSCSPRQSVVLLLLLLLLEAVLLLLV